MAFIEAPTTFYMGRTYNATAKALGQDVVYYDSRDLTTHAVVVGMTGSGKTGLCINMLEEAILDNIPSIIIDPKGDITNLLLTFPDLQPQDFQPWIQPDEARRAGMDLPSYVQQTAEKWRSGLDEWGIVPDRLRWLKHAAQLSIYTPGSDTGLPISILASLKAPQQWNGQEEIIRERINGTVTALLAMAGIKAEPVKDEVHVLVANIFEHNWRQGRDLTLENLIMQVKQPPFDKLGAFAIDQYIPEKARYKLAMELNSIIAAPSFQSWIHGEPLDIQNLLYQPNGRPRVSIFYIAHLSEAERMFITTLLLESMIAWMQTLSGTSSLRALLYIDEMYGYFPPYPRNPPTKEPIMRLLKQARAFGLGLILATQNPGDLDYKGLTNAGTWFIGRLQSDNDRKRVMDGLRQLASAEDGINLSDVESLIAEIQPRVFLMRNVHDTGGPLLLHTRWCMNYLAGPLTRQQISSLMTGQRAQLMQRLSQPAQRQVQMLDQTQPPPPPGFEQGGGSLTAPLPPGFVSAQAAEPARIQPAKHLPDGFSENKPPLPGTTREYFLPNTLTVPEAMGIYQLQGQPGAVTLAYRPVLFAQTLVRYQQRTSQIYTARSYAFRVPDLKVQGMVNWEQHQTAVIDRTHLGTQPLTDAIYDELPNGLTDGQRLRVLERELVDMLYNTARLIIPHHQKFKLYGDPDQEMSAFQAQVYQRAREERDQELDKLSVRYASRMDVLDDRLKRKERELEAEELEVRDRRREAMYTTGEAVLSIFRGRTNYTLSRMSRATRMKRQTEADLEESQEVIAEIEQEMFDLEQEYEQKLKEINDRWAQVANDTQEFTITPYKKDIHIEQFGVGWVPHWLLVMPTGPVLIQAVD